MNTEVKKLQDELDVAMKAGDRAKVRELDRQLEVAERLEVRALKAAAEAKWAEKSAAIIELTKRFDEAVGKVVAGFKAEIVKLVGEEEAMPHYSIDYHNGNSVVVGIHRPRVTARPASTGNGKRGKIKELFEQHATEAEKQALASDIAKVQASNPLARVDAIEYRHRTDVKKRLLEAGTIKAE